MDDIQTLEKSGSGEHSQSKPAERPAASHKPAEVQSEKSSATSQATHASRAIHSHHRRIPACPDEVVLAATAIAITLCNNKTVSEIQTLLNLFSTTGDLIDSILKQRLINKPFEPPILSVDLD